MSLITKRAHLDAICERAFAQMCAMIWSANSRKDKRPGDPKVGGHPASCASSLHILGALHLAVRDPHDFICCKPHAAPMDHAFGHLLGTFRHPDGTRFTDEESVGVMGRLRKFAEEPGQPVLQSYHAFSDPDQFHFLPSGSVGIPPVASVYLALAHRYSRDHGHEISPKAQYWSLIGDSEFREGSLLECMPDVAERKLGNVTWIIDYNRQNLDGTRIPNHKGHEARDCDRIAAMAEANGWDVVQLQHGAYREELFAEPGGSALKHWFDEVLSDYDFQLLLYKRDAVGVREEARRSHAGAAKVLDNLTNEDVLRCLDNVGGHDIEAIATAMNESRINPDIPTILIIHTIKGWGMECFADPSNHSALPSKKELASILESRGLTAEEPYTRFDADSDIGQACAARADAMIEGIAAVEDFALKNRASFNETIEAQGGFPESLDIDLSLFPTVHTQWMWGQLASKLIRIGTRDQGGPQMAGADKELSDDDQRWKVAADMVVTMSPDVGTSTNLSPGMDKRVYGPPSCDDDDGEKGNELMPSFDAHHPEIFTSRDAWTRHIRFEIAEANAMNAVGSFGKMGHFAGVPFFPVMTVYDFFIKRALDQLYYNLYWGCEFIILGTPSGVTLSSEGAQHSWKSDIQIPNLITWEPFFACELDWILCDALGRHMKGDNEGRKGVVIRGVTRGVRQALLLDALRRHAGYKAGAPASPLLKAGESGTGIDESTLAPMADTEINAKLRLDVLEGGYYLIDWRGYEGYEPGDNVVRIFSLGSVTTEAMEAAGKLFEVGIFADVIVITNTDLLLGIPAEFNDYRHLLQTLAVDGDLHAVPNRIEGTAEAISLAARRVPIVAICDGEAGLVDNIGSIVGVKQRTLAVRKFSKCGRPDQVFALQQIDTDAIVEAAGRALSETALEDLSISASLLDQLAGRPAAARPNWRELWQNA